MVVSIVFLFIPLIQTVLLAFQEVSFLNLEQSEFVGMQNFINLFSDPEFIMALKNSLLLVLMIVPATVLIALLLALLVNKGSRLNNFARTVFYLPYVLTPVAVAAIMTMLFKEDGAMTMLFHNVLGVENISWYMDETLSKLLISLSMIWISVGFYMTLYISALKSIPNEVVEAAKLDGVGKFTYFRKIVLPSVKNVTFLALFMCTLSTIQIFDIPYIISTTGGATAGGPAGATMTLVMYIYTQGFVYGEMGLAAAAGVVTIIIIASISIIQFVLLKGGENE